MQVEDKYRYFEGHGIVKSELSVWLVQNWNFAHRMRVLHKLSFFLLLCGFVSACAVAHIALNITAVTASFALACFSLFDCLFRHLQCLHRFQCNYCNRRRFLA